MASGNEQMRKDIAADIADKAEKKRLEIQAAQKEIVQATRAAGVAERDAQRNAEAEKLWGEARKAAEHLEQRGAEAYADLMATSMEVVHMLLTLVPAMNARMPIPRFLRDKLVRPAREGVDMLVSTGVDKVCDTLKAGIDWAMGKEEAPPLIELPTLNAIVGMDHGNRLNLFNPAGTAIDPSKVQIGRSDEGDLKPAHKVAAGGAIIAWLKQQGFKPSTTVPGQFLREADDTVLTSSEFETLRDDKDHGLANYLEETFGMAFTVSPPAP